MQQINFYQARFRPVQVRLNLFQSGLLIGGTLLLVVSATVWLIRFDQQLKQEEQQLALAADSLQSQVQLRKQELDILLNDQSLDDEIVELNREIQARERIVDYVNTRVIGSSQGYSVYLDTLAALQIKNVWLEEILITPEHLRVQGSALDAGLIPQYMQQFQQNSLFKGLEFDVFRIERDSAQDWKVDFELATKGTQP